MTHADIIRRIGDSPCPCEAARGLGGAVARGTVERELAHQALADVASIVHARGNGVTDGDVWAAYYSGYYWAHVGLVKGDSK